ncbi:unnamed protein product [Cyprideis torosa]|uniref:Uncharacterized protein n=1 Tax=Cyprideis torosa TaxID=163714 RepID=A0A7R8WD72_9CRUS|nr:unnamed protein product [Cyprideis torosa]CAG0894265.1 unnamed protein product [Cyprideis torosa]
MDEPAEKRTKSGTSPSSRDRAHLESANSNEPKDGSDSFDLTTFVIQKSCLCGASEEELSKLNLEECSQSTAQDVTRVLSSLKVIADTALFQMKERFSCSKIVSFVDSVVEQKEWVQRLLNLGSSESQFDTRSRTLVSYLTYKLLARLFILKPDLIQDVAGCALIKEALQSPPSGFLSLQPFLFVIQSCSSAKNESSSPIGCTEDLSVKNPNCDIRVLPSKSDLRVKKTVQDSLAKETVVQFLAEHWEALVEAYLSAPSSEENDFLKVSFLDLYSALVAIRSNLTVESTRAFFAPIVLLKNPLLKDEESASNMLWSQTMSVYNEALCYGSTLALQESVPDEVSAISWSLIASVSRDGLLDHVPKRLSSSEEDPLTPPDSGGSETPILYAKIVLVLLKALVLVIKASAQEVDESTSSSSASSLSLEEDPGGGADENRWRREDTLEERLFGSTSSSGSPFPLPVGPVKETLSVLDGWVKQRRPILPQSKICEWVVPVLAVQDDILIEALLCLLDTHSTLEKSCLTVGSGEDPSTEVLCSLVNPVHSFSEFLSSVSHDSQVLLDLLLGNETYFLLYLLKFLKYLRSQIGSVTTVPSASSGILTPPSQLDSALLNRKCCLTLSRLRDSIRGAVQKNLFPYNVNPILRLLETLPFLTPTSEGAAMTATSAASTSCSKPLRV